MNRPSGLPAPSGDLIHHRAYDVKVYREASDRLRVRGSIEDQKPPGVLIEDDPDPLTVHHMVVDLVIDFPSLTITDLAVEMATTPHGGCTVIEDDYRKLIGLSIARGFSRQVKDLLGGPRGCTHVGALLQAMAPAVIQSTWSMRALTEREQGLTRQRPRSPGEARASLAFNIDSCHIWAEDGPMVVGVLSGRSIEIPLWADRRLRELGRDPEQWVGG